MSSNNVMFHPIICSIQKLALYETKEKIYIVGSNNAQTRFRLLNIDRRNITELNITDDKIEYGFRDISNLVNKITTMHKARGSTVKIFYAFGIVGFIRFLHGYYIILITKRRRIAEIGLHILYKIEDTLMVPICLDSKNIHPNEPKYVKMFQSIDLKSNFYFSYSYDLTRPLQNNVAPPKYFSSKKSFNTPQDADYESDSEPLPNFGSKMEKSERVDYGFRRSPRMRFVWNSHLLKPIDQILHPDWILYITHGFIDQLHMSIFGRPVHIAIIARRSNKFAGTRFLKRGANFSGDVANEVETEQIVYDSGTSSLAEGRFSSFVQMRGSIPGHWSQGLIISDTKQDYVINKKLAKANRVSYEIHHIPVEFQCSWIANVSLFLSN
ncbi:polyphosphoinositide phosphatase-like [Ctenocephalides felis]|uniref:polyphosphoinositide phosphatase-like n=1 Tax=Ctenocephalides felis TaxID=7515 RepID=UPI000E6E28FA|nr:polyphosphoinositide phosphatase-like [Ctenocephalides felis]